MSHCACIQVDPHTGADKINHQRSTIFVGIYNRDYMRRDKRREPSKSDEPYRMKKSKSTLSWWQELKFSLWRLFNRK
jgi:hypothetical protein